MTLEQITSAVRRNLSNAFDCENIAADLFVVAWEKDESIQKNVTTDESFDVFVSHEVIRNRCIDEIRRRVRERKAMEGREVSRNVASEHFDSLFDIVDRSSASNIQPDILLDSILQKAPLTPESRTLLLEHYYLGKSLREIANHIGLNQTQIRALLKTTLETLKSTAMKGKEK